MPTSSITINVDLDNNKIPEQIRWQASDTTADNMQKANAMMIALWDSADKSAMRIDLWTKQMMVDEMADFMYQTLMSMADTYTRATQQQSLADEMKNFAKDFYKKAKEAASVNHES